MVEVPNKQHSGLNAAFTAKLDGAACTQAPEAGAGDTG